MLIPVSYLSPVIIEEFFLWPPMLTSSRANVPCYYVLWFEIVVPNVAIRVRSEWMSYSWALRVVQKYLSNGQVSRSLTPNEQVIKFF